MRILILSTPKTGSTWLRSLLSGIYRLPQLYLEPGFDCDALSRGGTRWVAQYHIRPHPELTAWIREQRAIAITTIRHPGDVLISFYYHLRDFRGQSLDFDFVRRMLSAGFERTNITIDSAGQPFWADLAYSLDWMSEPGTQVVRYEDLRCDPLGTLRELTSRIAAVPDERIEAAMEMSDLALMRRMAGPFGRFFREGRIGGWRDLLPPDVIEVFRSTAPYAAQMAALGYSMDRSDPLTARPVASRPRHPMTTLQHFENGAAVASILIQCFFWAGAEQRAHWQKQLAAIGPSSFYDWLNQPAEPAGPGLYEELPISNLAAFVYWQRPDVRLAYPDLSSSSRYAYAHWFLRHAETEYGIARAFVDPPRAGLLRWANATTGANGCAAATNFVLHICHTRTDVLGSFPHIRGIERRHLVRAVIGAAQALGMDAGFVTPLEGSLGRHWLPQCIRMRIPRKARMPQNVFCLRADML